ncbi:MAG: TraR/DksA C4-type zinc finger protein [Anaplasmataceae bacterium]|nr:TraR/DksA C4-type zinc finger protein [Anaplasmataceae bacterium]
MPGTQQNNNIPEYLLMAREFIEEQDRRHITIEDKKYFKDLLLKIKQDIINNMQSQINTISTEKTNDYTDMATMWNDNYLSTMRLESERNKLLNIDEALKKLIKNTYGYCELTGEKINSDRLRIYPLAKYCLEIQEKIENNLIKIE